MNSDLFPIFKQTAPLGLCALLVALIASGCALLPQPEIHPPDKGLPLFGTLSRPEAATEYHLTHAAVEIHTYRAGWLSQLAHGHVLETTELTGAIYLANPIEQSTARLYFRPWDLVLDDPGSRQRAGAGFESERSAEEVAATRTRMLGPKGFDSNDHPWVVIDVAWRDTDQVGLQIRIRNGRYAFDVPLTWSVHEDEIDVVADFELSHRALGIQPYSAFAGAIAVADPIRVQLLLSARPASSL